MNMESAKRKIAQLPGLELSLHDSVLDSAH